MGLFAERCALRPGTRGRRQIQNLMSKPKTPKSGSQQQVVGPRLTEQNIIMALTVVSLMANSVTVAMLVRQEKRMPELQNRVAALEALLGKQTTPQQSQPHMQ